MSSDSRSEHGHNSRRGGRKQAKGSPGVYCICKGGDTGTPMFECDGCHKWFHFKCVGVSEAQASKNKKTYCPDCQKIHAPSAPQKKRAKGNIWAAQFECAGLGSFSVSGAAVCGNVDLLRTVTGPIQLPERAKSAALAEYLRDSYKYGSRQRCVARLEPANGEDRTAFLSLHKYLVERNRAAVANVKDRNEEMYVFPMPCATESQTMPSFLAADSTTNKRIIGANPGLPRLLFVMIEERPEKKEEEGGEGDVVVETKNEEEEGEVKEVVEEEETPKVEVVVNSSEGTVVDVPAEDLEDKQTTKPEETSQKEVK